MVALCFFSVHVFSKNSLYRNGQHRLYTWASFKAAFPDNSKRIPALDYRFGHAGSSIGMAGLVDS